MRFAVAALWLLAGSSAWADSSVPGPLADCAKVKRAKDGDRPAKHD